MEVNSSGQMEGGSMKKIISMIGLVGVILISGCAGAEDRLVTPHPEKNTFIFFYTEG